MNRPEDGFVRIGELPIEADVDSVEFVADNNTYLGPGRPGPAPIPPRVATEKARGRVEKAVMAFLALAAVILSAAILIAAVTALIWVTRDANPAILVGIAVMTVALAVLVAVVWFTVEGRHCMRQVKTHSDNLENQLARIGGVVHAVHSVADAIRGATPQDIGTAQGIFK